MYQSLKPSFKGQLRVFLLFSILPVVGAIINIVMHAGPYITISSFITFELLNVWYLKILERRWMLDKITEEIPKESYTKGKKGFLVARLVVLIAGVTGLVILERGIIHFLVFCFLIVSELLIEIIWQSTKNKQLRLKIVSIFNSKISE
ncbi:MAG: hypothetical protein MJZ16_07565 [Bacteroidales bacterium]|nr:hypothetical protein [Bacteroidales bacterium]